jgi:hypothetical protein
MTRLKQQPRYASSSNDAVSAILGCQRNNGLRQRIFISTNNGGVTLVPRG